MNAITARPKRVAGRRRIELDGSEYWVELRKGFIRVRGVHKQKFREMPLTELVQWIMFGQKNLL